MKSIIIDDNSKHSPSFFGFGIFVTPLLIQITFICSILLSAWMGFKIWTLEYPESTALQEDLNALGIWKYILAILIPAAFLIMVRVFCELAIIWFKIYEKIR